MIIFFYLVLIFFTWTFFLAVMHLRIIRDTLGFTRANIVPAYTVLVIGLILDAILNIAMSLPLLDLPKELLLTGKFKRLIKEDMGWRGDVAEYLCQHFLVPADRGHCG